MERAEDAAVAAKPLGGDPLVDARSYLVQDTATNAPILGLNVAGQPAGAELNRAVTPPWLAGNVLGTDHRQRAHRRRAAVDDARARHTRRSR